MIDTIEATGAMRIALAVSVWVLGFALLTLGLKVAPLSLPLPPKTILAPTAPLPQIGPTKAAPAQKLEPGPQPLEEQSPYRPAPTSAPAPRGEIRFRRGAAKLSAADRVHLTRLAEALAVTRGSVLVEGHADAIGSDLRNLRLSRARARAVARALVAGGLPRSRIVIRAFGDFQPRPGHNGRAQAQRRVEVRLLEEVHT